MMLKRLLPTILAGSLTMASGMASAALVLTAEPAQTIGPQSTSAPCVIAGTTCQNPDDFAYTNFQQSGAISSYTESSPTYTVSQFSGLFGLPIFNIAIDVNTTNAQGETLDYFRTYVNGVLVAALSYEGDGAIGTIDGNGNGYADWTLRTVSLVGYNPGDTVQFRTKFDNATDGAESFFLVDGDGRPPAEVPVPAAAWLLASGLMAMGAIGRRRMKGMA
jgi:hypothetical protein